jgi:hypothetical protein
MAESTAGIGEAGALVNRAKAPATMDITRGIQMAESNALKKAQLEAAKEAKKQAKMAAMDKYRTIKTGLYKDPSVNEEAKRLGRELGYEMEAAVNSGDINKVSRLNQDLEFIKGDLKIKDAFLTSLAPNDKKVDTGDMLKAARQGKLPEYLQTESPLIQKYFDQDAEGFPLVIRPNKYNLDKAYDRVVASLGSDYVDSKAAAFDKIKMTKRVPPAVLRERAAAFILNDQDAAAALDWNPEFRKVFKEEYGNNLEREEEAKVNFVYNNLTKYNEPKYQMGSQAKGGGTFKITGSGFSIGDYNFSTIPKIASDFVEELETNRTMFGRDEAQNKIMMERNKLGGNNPVTEVAMPANSSGTFIVSDPFIGKVNKGRPVSLMQGAGQTYLIYLTNRNNEDRTQIVQMTPEILSQMATYYKTDPATFIEAYGAGGVDLSSFAPSGNINTKKGGGSTSKPAPVKGGGKAKDSFPVWKSKNPNGTAAQYKQYKNS